MKEVSGELIRALQMLRPIDVQHLLKLSDVVDCDICVGFLEDLAEWVETQESVSEEK